MIDFTVSLFATVSHWLTVNRWLAMYWVLTPLVCGYGAYFFVKHGDYCRNLRFVAGAAAFVVAVFVMMVYSGEFGFVF